MCPGLNLNVESFAMIDWYSVFSKILLFEFTYFSISAIISELIPNIDAFESNDVATKIFCKVAGTFNFNARVIFSNDWEEDIALCWQATDQYDSEQSRARKLVLVRVLTSYTVHFQCGTCALAYKCQCLIQTYAALLVSPVLGTHLRVHASFASSYFPLGINSVSFVGKSCILGFTISSVDATVFHE